MKNSEKWNVWKIDFHGVNWLKAFLFFVLFYFSYPLLENYYSCSSLDKLLSGFKIDFLTGVFLALIPFIIFIKKILRLYEGLLPKPPRLAGVMTFWAIYFWQWRLSGLYEFNLISCSPLAWFDLLPISLGLLFLKMKTYEKIRANNPNLGISYPEFTAKKLVPDLYHRANMASNVGNLITNSVNNEGATVIGIFSEWGSGKTDFLMRLKNVLIDLEKNDYDQINQVFEFNPWKYSAGEGIIQSFFNSFEQILIKYNDDIDTLFRDYLKDIMGNSRSLDVKFLQTLMLNMFDNNKDLTVQQKIKNTLNSTGKRFVIYIDDIDRLTGKEIVEVFKLVRVIADFPNVFFVVTMDYEYVIKTVEKTNEIDNIEQYIKKIFNVYYRLPIVKKETIISQLMALIAKEKEIKDELRIKFKQILNQINERNDFTVMNDSATPVNVKDLFGLVERMLLNSRDVLQFYNSIKGHLVNLNEEVDLTDLILLELLKVYSFSTYNSLSIQDESLLEIENGRYCKIKKENIDPITVQVLEQLIATNDKSIAKFCDVINHYLYFSYTLPENMVSRKEFNKALRGSDSDFLIEVSNWLTNQKDDFIGVLWKVDNFKIDEKAYRKYLITMLRFKNELGNYSGSLEIELSRFEKTFIELKIINPQEFINNILKGAQLRAADKLRFAGTLQRIKFNQSVDVFFKTIDLLPRMELLFKEALDDFDSDNYDETALDFLFYIREPFDDGKLRFYGNSCEVFKKFLEKGGSGLVQYVTELIVAGSKSVFENIYIKGFPFSEIFPDHQDFISLLNDPFTNENAENWRKAILNIPQNKFVEEEIASPGEDWYDELHKLYMERLKSKTPKLEIEESTFDFFK